MKKYIKIVLRPIICPIVKLIRFDYKFEWPILIFYARFRQRLKLKSLQSKEVINVVFFVINEASWKYSEVYQRLQNNKRFKVSVLVCPMVNHGKEEMIRTMERSYFWFLQNGYNVKLAYDKISDTYIDARKIYCPDIIFYSNPYNGLIEERYFITRFLDCLTIYASYMFNNNSDFNFSYNELLHNLVWRFYLETREHKVYAEQSSMSKGRNIVVTGYVGIEKFINGYKPITNPWKKSDKRYKKIIWAPHWTIQKEGGCVNFSCFLQYADSMVELAQKYQDSVEFVFKPHPLLRTQLESLWGKERTNAYYNIWATMSNTGLCEGDYKDLFILSDAMVHDCGSFINEYLFLNKPVMRTMKHGDCVDMYDPFTQRALEHYYKAYDYNDIETFILNVSMGNDPLKVSRNQFVRENLFSSDGVLPSVNILNDIVDSIDNQILYRN